MFWSSPGQTYLISLYGAEIREAFDLSHAEFGGLYSLGTLLSAALMLWSGRLIDVFSLRVLAITVSIILALACWFMSMTTGVVTLAIAFFLLRQTGQGLMSHLATTAMSRYFENVRGTATSIAALGFALAEACLPVATILIIGLLGWRDAWRVTGAALLVCAIPAIWILLRDHRARHQRYLHQLKRILDAPDQGTVRRQWTRGEVLRDRRFYLAIPAFLSPSFFFTGFFFHQVHLVSAKNWDLMWWGAWFILYAASSLLATIVTGPLVDRVGAVRLMPMFPLPLAFALLVLSVSDAQIIGLLFLFLTGVTAGWSITVMGPMWAELYGVLHLGSIKALATALSVLASALSPFLLGWLIDVPLSIDLLAFISGCFILLACAAAAFAFR